MVEKYRQTFRLPQCGNSLWSCNVLLKSTFTRYLYNKLRDVQIWKLHQGLEYFLLLSQEPDITFYCHYTFQRITFVIFTQNTMYTPFLCSSSVCKPTSTTIHLGHYVYVTKPQLHCLMVRLQWYLIISPWCIWEAKDVRSAPIRFKCNQIYSTLL